MLRRMKYLESELSRFRRMYADNSLQYEIVKEALEKSSEASGRLELDRDRPGGSGLDMFELDNNRTDCAKTAGRGICLDRVRESEFVGPDRPTDQNEFDERDSLFQSCSGNRNWKGRKLGLKA